MRLLPLILIVIVGYIAWKLVKLFKLMRNSADRDEEQARVDFPQDQSYKNIEDADFEDLGRDPDTKS